MATASRTLLSGNRWDRGFSLIELLIVALIVGILAAVATPLYLGYIKDAKTVEAKAVAGSLWTAVQSNAIAQCGSDVKVSDGYAKAGLTSEGVTSPARWTVTGGDATLRVTCATGAYTATPKLLFMVAGTGADVESIRVALHYTGGNPPAVLRCRTDKTDPTESSPVC